MVATPAPSSIATVDILDQESPGITVVATTLTVPPGDVELPWNPGADGTVWSTVMQSAGNPAALQCLHLPRSLAAILFQHRRQHRPAA